MSKPCLASIATFLAWASIAFGQNQEAPLAPMPQQVERAPTHSILAEGIGSCWGEASPASGHTIRGLFTADLEYVLWFIPKPDLIAPLASTDVLGRRTTESLGGRRSELTGIGSGARAAIGYWQAEDNLWAPGDIRHFGVEAVFFFVGQRSHSLLRGNCMTIVRPFCDLNNNQESAFVVAAPGVASGTISGEVQGGLWGAEANLWKNFSFDYPGTSYSIDGMIGFRYLDMNERLSISSVSAFNQDLPRFSPFAPLSRSTLQVCDSFATRNNFYGGQIGISAKWWPMDCHIGFEGTAKFGIGVTSENLEIAGNQVLTAPDGTKSLFPGGLLALPSNIGHFHRSQFSQVLGLDFKMSAPLADYLTIYTDFSALYWSKLLRPAEQIDRNIDITQIPNFPPGALASPTGLNEPAVPFRQSNMWLLGVSIGLELRW